MHELDRLFDCYDVLGEVLVDEVDEGGLSCCFAGAGWTGYENKPAAQITKFFDHHRDTQLFETRNFRWNQSKSRGITVRFLKVVGAESRVLIHLVSKIEITVLLEKFPILRAAYFAQHASGFLV